MPMVMSKPSMSISNHIERFPINEFPATQGIPMVFFNVCPVNFCGFYVHNVPVVVSFCCHQPTADLSTHSAFTAQAASNGPVSRG